MNRFRFDIQIRRKTEIFTGVFETEEEADKWYNNHGKWWEEQGKILIKVKVK